MKFATKPIRHCPPHLRHVAILPWEIKNSNFLQIFSTYEIKYKQIAFLSPLTSLFIQKNFIFSVFKIASLSPYWLQIQFSMSLFFYLFTFAINLWHRKFATADVTAVFVSNQHGIQWRKQDVDKKFVFEGVHTEEVVRRISEASNCLECNLFAFSSICAEYPQKICIFNFPRKYSNMPKVRWAMLYGVCSTFHALSSSAKILNIG